MKPSEEDLRSGALNLLQGCAGVGAGDELVIVHESPKLGWYDNVPQWVAEVAQDLGAAVTLREADGPSNDVFDETRIAGDGWDRCVYFARVGDQIRFDPMPDSRTRVMSYASTLAALASSYGRTTHAAMLDMKQAIDEVMSDAGTIRIRCALGTDLTGNMTGEGVADDVTLRRFPMGVHTPIRAAQFSGTVALARYLTPTGSKVYDPAWVAIGEPVHAEISSGRTTGFTGSASDVKRVEAHHRQVAEEFDLEADDVSSWHAGIHPGRSFETAASEDPDRWSNTVFTSPRFVHFHTCGTGVFGEIAWMVLDPTISVDGVALWENGVLRPERFAGTARCLTRWPELQELFRQPKPDVGVRAAR